MDFVAIDFETANGNPNSACQLAAVVVSGGEITQEREWLIRPPRNYFAPRNIAIHGIRPGDVINAPTMEQVWGELQALADGNVLIAHNARFDIGVLIHSLSAHDVACPQLEFTCTRLLARRAWPGKAKYGLKPLGDALGIRFKHHDALEDSRCCALIALRVAETMKQTALDDLEQQLRITRGTYRHGKIQSPRAIRGTGGRQRAELDGSPNSSSDRWGFPLKQSRQRTRIDAENVLHATDQPRPLEGKHIVMLGPLGGMTMEETNQLLMKLGANIETAISHKSDYVVAAGAPLADAKSLIEQRSASDMREEQASLDTSAPSGSGQTIRLLSERQFRALLPGGKSLTAW